MDDDQLKYRKHSLLRFSERYCPIYENEIPVEDKVFLERIKLDYSGLIVGTKDYRKCDNYIYEKSEIPNYISDFFLRAYYHGQGMEKINDPLLVNKINKKQQKYNRAGIRTFAKIFRSFYVYFDCTTKVDITQTLYELEDYFRNPNPIQIKSARRYNETVGPHNRL